MIYAIVELQIPSPVKQGDMYIPASRSDTFLQR